MQNLVLKGQIFCKPFGSISGWDPAVRKGKPIPGTYVNYSQDESYPFWSQKSPRVATCHEMPGQWPWSIVWYQGLTVALSSQNIGHLTREEAQSALLGGIPCCRACAWLHLCHYNCFVLQSIVHQRDGWAHILANVNGLLLNPHCLMPLPLWMLSEKY